MSYIFNGLLKTVIVYLFRKARDNLRPDEHGRYHEISTVKENIGPVPSLSSAVEEKIRLYIEDCYRIGLPRYQEKCLCDIQAYLNMNKITVPRFNDNKPGIYFHVMVSSNCPPPKHGDTYQYRNYTAKWEYFIISVCVQYETLHTFLHNTIVIGMSVCVCVRQSNISNISTKL